MSIITCSVTWKDFEVSQDDLEFYKKVSPKIGWETFAVPYPTMCPEERQRTRMAFRNERHLYRRVCDASWKQIISMYSPDKNFKVYDQNIRRSDQRSAFDYGQDFDFSKTFHQNFKQLYEVVPKIALMNRESENSNYCNPWLANKDCYFVFSVTNSVGCLYGRLIDNCEYCLDCLAMENCQICSNCIQLFWCYNCHYSIQLKNCSYCRECVWLENKMYNIRNQQYTKEEYFDLISKEIWVFPQPNRELFQMNIWDSQDCTLAFDIEGCKHCFDIRNSTDISYSSMVKPWCSDCMDCTLLIDSTKCFESMSTSKIQWWVWLVSCWDWNDVYYTFDSYFTKNVFWCVSLRRAEYCVFNKQYTKLEYEALTKKIIWHMMETWEWWRFFDPSLSPFWYNETIAQEYYPLEQTDTLIQSWKYNWSGYESPQPVSDRVIDASTMSTDVDTVSDEILSYAIKCSQTGKLFRIQKQELDFYRKNKLSLPRVHPDVRHTQRVNLRK